MDSNKQEKQTIIEENPPTHYMSQSQVNKILLENAALILSIRATINRKRNKNFTPTTALNMSNCDLSVIKMQRNLIRLCRNVKPYCLNNEKILQKQKQIFQKYYGKKKK